MFNFWPYWKVSKTFYNGLRAIYLHISLFTSGKTYWVSKFLRQRHELVKPSNKGPIKHVYLYYKEFQPVFAELLSQGLVTRLIEDFPEYETWHDDMKSMKNDGGCICIFDDSMGNYDLLGRIFTVGSHHTNTSVKYNM